MLDRMSASELAEWEELERIEPFGERALWIRHAIQCALLVNINTPAERPRSSIEDFLPQTLVSKSSETMDPEQMKATMMLLMDHQNAISARQREAHGENR
jgi:hypothetical protein